MAVATNAGAAGTQSSLKSSQKIDKDANVSNIKYSMIKFITSVSKTLQTCLGPKGCDKLVYTTANDALITNDGATIMKQMKLLNPIARMMKTLAEAQDKQAGDGTTSVIVFCGSLIEQCKILMENNFHTVAIIESLNRAKDDAIKHIDSVASNVDMTKLDIVTNVAQTALNSKVISSYGGHLSALAVEAVMKVYQNSPSADTISPTDVKIIKVKGDSIENSKIVDGIMFESGVEPCCKFGKVSKKENAKVALVQFHFSPPKPYLDSLVVVNDAAQMDNIEKDEKDYLVNIIEKVQNSGASVLIIQKSILRESVSKMARLLLNECNIMFIDNVDRTDMSFVSKKLGCKPIASPDHLATASMATVELCKKVSYGGRSFVEITGIAKPQSSHSQYHQSVDPTNLVLFGSNQMFLDEAERSMFDSISAVVSLFKDSLLVAGGGAIESNTSFFLEKKSKDLVGIDHYVYKSFAEALKVIPFTLCQNAGINPLKGMMALELAQKDKGPGYGINAKGEIADMEALNVVQPCHVTKSFIRLATEFICTILRVDEISHSR